MTSSPHHLAHLASLIEAAKVQAESDGPELGRVARLLGEALAAVRGLRANGGRADEGLRPEELNTENDE